MSSINHIFVLMLENRSFDQMLGFSGITGIDSGYGNPTVIDGLSGKESNLTPDGKTVTVSSPAGFVAKADPGHEFLDVREQLCGKESEYSDSISQGAVDPKVTNKGFVSSYVGKYPSEAPEDVMRCYSPAQLPVLTKLATEFVVCDHWFSSMPGPTWPNRFFVHAATAGGLDHSPSLPKEIVSGAGDPYRFANGTVFELMDSAGLDWSIYMGDEFPQALHMEEMAESLGKGRFKPMESFETDLTDKSFRDSYVFIEPDWHPFTKFKGGNSQHPLDDVTRGEQLIKRVYEAVRNSPVWESAMLVITYDEHGGFFDHVAPPVSVDPGDAPTNPDNNKYNFGFKQLGVRVPAVVVSPYVPRGTIDHHLYDHSSIPATIEDKFNLSNLTQRDKEARSLLSLSSSVFREDCPTQLPPPANSGVRFAHEDSLVSRIRDGLEHVPAMLHLSNNPVDPALAGFVHIALQLQLAASKPSEREEMIDRARRVRTETDAKTYLRRIRKETSSLKK